MLGGCRGSTGPSFAARDESLGRAISLISIRDQQADVAALAALSHRGSPPSAAPWAAPGPWNGWSASIGSEPLLLVTVRAPQTRSARRQRKRGHQSRPDRWQSGDYDETCGEGTTPGGTARRPHTRGEIEPDTRFANHN